jgi:hypothetical protein
MARILSSNRVHPVDTQKLFEPWPVSPAVESDIVRFAFDEPSPDDVASTTDRQPKKKATAPAFGISIKPSKSLLTRAQPTA